MKPRTAIAVGLIVGFAAGVAATILLVRWYRPSSPVHSFNSWRWSGDPAALVAGGGVLEGDLVRVSSDEHSSWVYIPGYSLPDSRPDALKTLTWPEYESLKGPIMSHDGSTLLRIDVKTGQVRFIMGVAVGQDHPLWQAQDIIVLKAGESFEFPRTEWAEPQILGPELSD